jgi:hypothetical protein
MILRARNLRLAILVTSLLSFLASCEKEKSGSGTGNPEEAEVSRVSSEANSEAEGMFNSLFDDVLGANDDVGVAGTGVFYGRMDTMTPVPHCFTVTIEHPNGTPFPARITIDFGTAGCAGPDGHIRKGKVITEYTARLINPGAMATMEFDNFFVDDTKVEGLLRITNVAASSPDRKYKVEVVDGRLSKANGNYIKWNSTRFITQVTGIPTPTPLDDIIKIEGSSEGQALRGNLLVGWQSARWIVRGRIRTAKLNSNPNSPWIAQLDFGNGICDDQAVLTINGQAHQITLP